jgi:hypothetical protein
MGETIAALIPWKARTGAARYLSFLPLNHVVEGILGIYAPYYLPVPLDISFLEDFRGLPRALLRVRPTVFFSVPRVYERVWEAFEGSRIGRFYLRLQPGRMKDGLRPLLRRFVLRRAGLDRCVQLLVGSAPTSEALLRAFHELGIEIHNAYGLTEAPLVTLNRLGANRIGTAGTPLPETEVCLAEDGEILVRGPQVTPGYCDEGVEQPFRDGRLLTGDLGHLTPEGSLVIEGRKKEVIATSYGKKIQPAKVEALLREIPGVAEAMLVGDCRPYCVALLWTDGDPGDETLRETIGRAVEAANSRLSHPEQVKRWALLANDLSIEGGDLTANLKLKRQAILRRFQQVVEQLYQDGPATPDNRPRATHAPIARGGEDTDRTGGGTALAPPMPPPSLPEAIRRAVLVEIFKATAAALETNVPRTQGLSYDALLLRYALFTRREVERATREGRDLAAIQDRLYTSAYRLGRTLRRFLCLGNMEKVMACGRVLYRGLGIDLEGDAEGRITIRRCYFSRLYSADTCRVIEALDQGLFAGLSDGGQLVFTARITEGEATCKACLYPKRGPA